jgi:RNA polymerase sigma-70 factor (ECF subfamily)
MMLSTTHIALIPLEATADSELVARSISGCEDGFEELVRRYQRPIAAYIYRMVNDYEAALDLTQDVFIKVYNSLGRYRAEYKFSTWIYRIAHNASVDHIRRRAAAHGQSRTAALQGETCELPIASAELNPEQGWEREERRAEIETIVRELPTSYRELIILRHSHDLSYDEISEVMNLPLGTVKNRLFRAREMMRSKFIQKGITGVAES